MAPSTGATAGVAEDGNVGRKERCHRWNIIPATAPTTATHQQQPYQQPLYQQQQQQQSADADKSILWRDLTPYELPIAVVLCCEVG